MSSTILRPLFRGLTLAAVALVAACGGDSGGPSGPSAPSEPSTPTPSPVPTPAPQPGPQPGPVSGLQGHAIFGLTCYNQLVLFGSENPDQIQREVPITGMPAGAVMLAIDFRGQQLRGVGSDSRLYTVDTLTAAATPIGAPFATPVSGEHFGLAYDAARDELHLSSAEDDQNLAIDGATGAIKSEGPALAYAAEDMNYGQAAAVTAETYFGPALFGIETNANAVVKVSQATGAVETVQELPFNVYLCSGLDVGPDGVAYAALATDNGSELYRVDLLTGEPVLVGGIGGAPVHSIAVRP